MAKEKGITQRIMTADEIKQFHAFEKDGPLEASGVGGGIIRRLIRFGVSIVVTRAKKNNPDFDEDGFRAEVDSAVEAIGDGQLWKWLVDGGFEQLLEWLMLLLELFGGFAKSK